MPTNDLYTSPIRTSLLAVWRYKWRAAAVCAATVAAAAAVLAVVPREYESEAKLFVRIGRENAGLDPTVTTADRIALSASRETEINSIVEHLRSRYLIEKTFDLLEPGYAAASALEREEALRELQESIFVSSPDDSTILLVHCMARSPERAQKTVATLLDVYLDEHMRINRSSGSHGFFVEQCGVVKQHLDAARIALRDAKNKAGMASMEGGRAALEAQISAAETQVRQVGASLAASQAKLASLQGHLDEIPEPLLSRLLEGTPNDGLAGMREKLFELRARQQEILSTCTPEHPRAIAIRLQVEGLEKSLQATEPDRDEVLRAVLARAASEEASLVAQKEQLEAQLADLRNKLLKLNQDELLIASLTSEVEQLDAKHRAYAEKAEEARMDDALRADRITNVSVIQPASFVPKPARPQKAAVLVIAMLLGSFAGLAVALVSDQHVDSQRAEGEANGSGSVLGPTPSSVPARQTTRNGDAEKHYAQV